MAQDGSLGLQEVEFSRLYRRLASTPHPQICSWYSFLLEAESTPDHSVIGWMKSVKNPATLRLAPQCLSQTGQRVPLCSENHDIVG
jgi:hypothetical protein